MAVIVDTEHPQRSPRPLSISILIDKLKLRRRPSKKLAKSTPAPVPQIPQEPLPPLNPSPLPLVLPEHQHTLSQLGWTTITFPSPSSTTSLQSSSETKVPPPNEAHPLQCASADLFAAAQLFFDQPDQEKGTWKHRLGTEEGWSKVEGEKEFITLRTLEYMPEVLKDAAARYWALMAGTEGGYLRSVVERVEGSLGLPVSASVSAGGIEGGGGEVGLKDAGGEGARREDGNEEKEKTTASQGQKHHTPSPNPLLQFLPPTPSIPQTDAEKTSSMIRIFRYTLSSPSTPPPHSDKSKQKPPPTNPSKDLPIVAEPHADLGLLSIVTGDVPGLEVWNGHRFLDIERHYARSGAHAATMLVGRQLEMFSNGRYRAGGHRVVSYPPPSSSTSPPLPNTNLSNTTNTEHDPSPSQSPKYRHSIVFVLRAHEPVPLHSRDLESRVTGTWRDPVFGGVTAGQVYEGIRNAHYNINIGKDERERQRRGVEEKKKRVEMGVAEK